MFENIINEARKRVATKASFEARTLTFKKIARKDASIFKIELEAAGLRIVARSKQSVDADYIYGWSVCIDVAPVVCDDGALDITDTCEGVDLQ